jgi:TetR/AcrR family transcriptional regulator, transcriptional repressor for nem operon
VLRLRVGVRRLRNLERPRWRSPTGGGECSTVAVPVIREQRHCNAQRLYLDAQALHLKLFCSENFISIFHNSAFGITAYRLLCLLSKGAEEILFRRHGYAATGIDAVMASAHLTAGAFYSHFRSKQVLLAKALDSAFRQSRGDWQEKLRALRGRQWAREFAAFYLSGGHRDAPDVGCPTPALTAEVSRSGGASRAVYERHLRDLVDTVAQQCNPAAPDRDRAISSVALSVGGLMLARAVKDPRFRKKFSGFVVRQWLRAVTLKRRNEWF